MIYVMNDRNDPFFNHAAEEYLMNHFDEEVLMLWINKPSILIGRNQNTLSEINFDYIKENEIEVVRRLSGGGTVYNDQGNINFTFITYSNNSRKTGENRFEKFANPIIEALGTLGIEASFSGRNDITIDGKKISGNAQYFQGNKLLHHGTILYDCNLKELGLALKSKDIKFQDKSVKSVSSRVTNIIDYMASPLPTSAFRQYLESYLVNTEDVSSIYEFTESDLEAIEKIASKRFRSWDWNYGKSPAYKYENAVKYPCGVVEYHLNVENGWIKDISIHGDFFGKKNVSELEEKLLNCRHEDLDLADRLGPIEVDDYILGLSKEEFIEALMDVKNKKEAIPMNQRKPEWIRTKIQGGNISKRVNNLISDLSLNTVCTEASCPNKMECFNRGTATFIVLGKNCTRNCTFCNVTKELPEQVDPLEPINIAKAIQRLQLKHAVITSVTRDDLEDQGANHFKQIVEEIRLLNPEVTVELLIPDMQGRKDLIDIIIDSEPDVLNHNIETVPELYSSIRPMAIFDRSIELLKYVKEQKPHMRTKSGMMLGLGESRDQVLDVLKRLREADCDMLTLGQYLQPSQAHVPLVEYIHPDQFEEYRLIALDLGFKKVASSPLVRSSYYAEDF